MSSPSPDRVAGAASTATAVALLVFLYAPLLVVVLFAFNAGSGLALPLRGLSLRWFAKLLADQTFGAAFLVSLRVALLTAVLAAVVGSVAAFGFVRRPWRVTTLVEAASRLPVMVPPLLLGVALLTTIDALGLVPSLVTVTAGHLVYVIPFVVVVVGARLRSFDLDTELAARDLGAGPAETLGRVTWPAVWPAVVAAAAVAFAFSFDEILITTFTSGQESTLPLYVVSRLRRTIDPSVNAVATILLGVPWLALAVGGLTLRLAAGRARRREAGRVGAPGEAR